MSYIFLLVIPVNLYLMHVTAPIVSTLDTRLWLSLGSIFIVLIFWYVKRKDKILNFSILWFYIFILQAFFLMMAFYGNKISMFEHWIYLASIGVYIIVGYLFYLSSKYIRIAVYPLIAIILLVYAILTQVNYSSYRNAVSLSKRILRFNPDNKEAHKELASVYLEQKRYRDSFEHIDKAIKLAPFDSDLYILQGTYYEGTGDVGLAVNSYERLLKIEPHSARANNNLGVIYFDKGDFNKARLFLRQAIDFNPLLFEAYLNMGKLCTKTNEIKEAVSFYKQAIELNPDNGEAFVSLAKIYFNKGDFKSANDVLSKALTSGHRDETILVLLGIVNDKLGFNTRADCYFKEALRLGSKSAETMLNIGVFYANQGWLNKAIEIWQEALNKNPDNKIIKENIDKARRLLRRTE
jgi:Flp pilus assembly protein TadD